ncbi:MAG: FtsX-like permease family protein [Syntrophomonadaceae bacterium]|nr:FtsX-like permease family protein [Syntrophomonadaceae bacterium]
MGILTRKLWRYIKHNMGQFLAVSTVVMAGVIVYIAMSSSYYVLSQSRDQFYRDNNFADQYFQVVKAPEGIVKQLQMIPGVKSITGRTQRDLSIIKANGDRGTARVVSYSLPLEKELNRLTLVEGRYFADNRGGSPEVVLDPKFLAANDLAWGDQVTVVVDGKEVFLTVVGSAISPEFIYAMKDSADILPDPMLFGIFMLENRQAQEILNMPGQINQVLLEFTPGADQTQVVEEVKSILRPYGLLASYPRRDQMSHAILQGELDQLRSITIFLPAIFLGIAAAIQFVILRRLIRAQRTQIGIMKAIGYNSSQIMLHYSSYAVIVSLFGALAGTWLGHMLSGTIATTYAAYFNLPGLTGGHNLQAIISGLLLSMAVAVIAGVSASRGVLNIKPAEAMRPEPPRRSGQTILEKWVWLWQRLNPVWKMTLRNISRNRGRFGVTILGVAFAVALLVIALFTNDAVDYIMQRYFYGGQSYDLSIRFNSVLPEKELLNISRIDGVQKVEGFLELPVKLNYGSRSEDEVLIAYPPDLTMKKLESDQGEPIRIPTEGLLINQRTASKLGVEPGAVVEVETLMPTGPVHYDNIEIAGEIRQLIGGGSYIDLQRANAVLQERNLVSGAMIKVEPAQLAAVENEIGKMLNVTSVISRQKELQNFEKNLESMIYSIGLMILFAIILGYAIVYNSAVMNYAERQREIACLRVIGYTTGEAASLLRRESLLHTVIGVGLGLPLGRLIAQAYVQSVSTDLYTLPVVIYPLTYLFSAIGGIIFIRLAHHVALKGIKQLDLAATLKNSD